MQVPGTYYELGCDAPGLVGVSGPAVGEAVLPPRILNMTVPHVGQRPLIALRPFFITSSTASTISFLALHLTQYPLGIVHFLGVRATRPPFRCSKVGAASAQRQRQ